MHIAFIFEDCAVSDKNNLLTCRLDGFMHLLLYSKLKICSVKQHLAEINLCYIVPNNAYLSILAAFSGNNSSEN